MSNCTDGLPKRKAEIAFKAGVLENYHHDDGKATQPDSSHDHLENGIN